MISAPALVLENVLYFVSVKPGNVKAEKIIYRMIKVKVTTQEENDAMYSTDSDSSDNEDVS